MTTSARRVRVLVADDQPIHREMIVRALASSPHHARLDIQTADDGDQALSAIARGIDIAFLDIRMPGKTGFEVLAAARRHRAAERLVAIIVSSSSDPKDRARATSLGAVGYVEKGRYATFRDELVAALGRVLDGKPLQ